VLLIHSSVLLCLPPKKLSVSIPKALWPFDSCTEASLSRFGDEYGAHVLFFLCPLLSKGQDHLYLYPFPVRHLLFLRLLCRNILPVQQFRTVFNIKKISCLASVPIYIERKSFKFLLMKIATTPPSPLDFCMGP